MGLKLSAHPARPGKSKREATGRSQATAMTAAGPAPSIERPPVTRGRPNTAVRAPTSLEASCPSEDWVKRRESRKSPVSSLMPAVMYSTHAEGVEGMAIPGSPGMVTTSGTGVVVVLVVVVTVVWVVAVVEEVGGKYVGVAVEATWMLSMNSAGLLVIGSKSGKIGKG